MVFQSILETFIDFLDIFSKAIALEKSPKNVELQTASVDMERWPIFSGSHKSTFWVD